MAGATAYANMLAVMLTVMATAQRNFIRQILSSPRHFNTGGRPTGGL
jgi:hypothetical protein